MIAKLIVASGKSAGRSISIKRDRLLIGRAEECDVRPLSEDVSRRHCEVIVGPAEVWVADLGSRNGTFVNSQRISEKTKVVDGDIVRVGALELKVSCVDPAAKAGTEDDVSRWLVADEKPAGMFDTTQTMPLQPPAELVQPARAPSSSDASVVARSPAAVGDAIKAAKSAPGALPTAAKKKSDSSRDAAAEALKKFFENR
ncbi:MAG: FHA domain-containing protein [Pirellulales bacterium]